MSSKRIWNPVLYPKVGRDVICPQKLIRHGDQGFLTSLFVGHSVYNIFEQWWIFKLVCSVDYIHIVFGVSRSFFCVCRETLLSSLLYSVSGNQYEG